MPITISVAVKAHAKRESVTQVSAVEYQVSVKAPPHDGKANLAIIELLSEYFSVPKSKIKIVRGHAARKKLLTIG
jgi:uncharacterized protein (TIGR00251 family)